MSRFPEITEIGIYCECGESFKVEESQYTVFESENGWIKIKFDPPIRCPNCQSKGFPVITD